MTEAERRAVREARDADRRARIAAEEQPLCERCGDPFEPNPARPTKRFCSELCRKQHWYRTPSGRRYKLLARRRRRRRLGMAHRPNAEVAL